MSIKAEIATILNNFPKQRSELPPAYQRIYEEAYKENRDGVGFIGKLKAKLEDWMHIQVALPPKQRILEVGAGTLNHVKFETDYQSYDIIEPMPFLYKNSAELAKLNNIYKNSTELPANTQYSHITSIAVFEHMTDLPQELINLVNSLKKNGTFQVAIPTEGGLLWYLSWRLVTGGSFYLKHKLDYKPFMQHEHVNNSHEIEALIKYLFNEVKVRRFPFNLFHLSFYTYIEARDVKQAALKQMALNLTRNT